MATLPGCRLTPESPDFARGSELIENAFLMTQAAHARPESETEIDHPVAVARLLSEQEFDETVVAAALLHDTVEDNVLTKEKIEASFGGAVAELVVHQATFAVSTTARSFASSAL